MPTRMETLQKGQDERLAAGETRASALETRADEARSGFVAADEARQVATATFESFRKGLGEDVESLRGSQVGRGRLDTGFGFEDEDRLVTESVEGLNRELARQAFTAASLNLENIGGISRSAESARDRDLDLLTGSQDRAQAQENADRQRKRRRFGLLGGALGAGAGFLLGGLPGASLGARLGGAAGAA